MSTSSSLPDAAPGDALEGADLQASIDRLEAWAAALDAGYDVLTDVAEVQRLARVQQDLRSRARSLVGRQIELAAGQARVTAGQIDAATRYAQQAIDQAADWREKLRRLGKVADFFAVVATGNGTKIVQAAVTLKTALDETDKKKPA